MREVVDAERVRAFMRAVGREGVVSFHHYDLTSQDLARGLVTPPGLRDRFERIAPLLHRFPAIDPGSFRRALEDTLGGAP